MDRPTRFRHSAIQITQQRFTIDFCSTLAKLFPNLHQLYLAYSDDQNLPYDNILSGCETNQGVPGSPRFLVVWWLTMDTKSISKFTNLALSK